MSSNLSVSSNKARVEVANLKKRLSVAINPELGFRRTSTLKQNNFSRHGTELPSKLSPKLSPNSGTDPRPEERRKAYKALKKVSNSLSMPNSAGLTTPKLSVTPLDDCEEVDENNSSGLQSSLCSQEDPAYESNT